jgi:hypothetical protein
MAETAQMPKSIQSDISVDAVGEALLQHYNMGITNPWHEAGYSDQETYNRRMLPWSGKNYTVDENGNVSGPNAESVPEGLKEQWASLAQAARQNLKGEEYDDLTDLYENGLMDMKDALS